MVTPVLSEGNVDIGIGPLTAGVASDSPNGQLFGPGVSLGTSEPAGPREPLYHDGDVDGAAAEAVELAAADADPGRSLGAESEGGEEEPELVVGRVLDPDD
jgi:hypothetical protein